MSQTITRTIRLSPADNVVVARAALRADTRVEEEGLTTIEAIDPGHKGSDTTHQKREHHT